MRIVHVAGARPNFMKVAPVMEALAARPGIEQLLVHTGQHYDDVMSKVFFDDLGIPAPDINLGVGTAPRTLQIARIMAGFAATCREIDPDLVIVVGDVNSTLACAVTAARLGIPLAHVEAGLRSFDWSMPEEVNRVITDRLSDILFTTEPSANENLRREGFPAERVQYVGNVMVDSLMRNRDRAVALQVPARLGLERGTYVLVTLHRPRNVDDPVNLSQAVAALRELAEKVPVVFPVHPRTRGALETNGVLHEMGKVHLLEPLGYLEFIGLLEAAGLVLTDSGGIQEETTALGVQCLTLRPNTERPVTVHRGTNRLITTLDTGEVVNATLGALDGDRKKAGGLPDLWDGQAASRVAHALAVELNSPAT